MQQGCACVGLIDSGHVACHNAEEFHAAQLAYFKRKCSIHSLGIMTGLPKKACKTYAVTTVCMACYHFISAVMLK